VVILIPALAWWKLGLNEVVAFWAAYVVTRPLGASFADYISKPQNLSGINFGNGPTAVVFALVVAVLVLYLAIARPDIQQPRVAFHEVGGADAHRADARDATGSAPKIGQEADNRSAEN
jgi:hypothetical protein